MATFSPLPYRFPIGFIQLQGQRDPTPVYPDKAFWDFLNIYVYERIGGASGMSSTEIEAAIGQLIAGEQLWQPKQFDIVFGDVMQSQTAAQMAPEVMQMATQQDAMPETFQQASESCQSEMVFQQ